MSFDHKTPSGSMVDKNRKRKGVESRLPRQSRL
jgi:hypothetical protein